MKSQTNISKTNVADSLFIRKHSISSTDSSQALREVYGNVKILEDKDDTSPIHLDRDVFNIAKISWGVGHTLSLNLFTAAMEAISKK